MALEKPHHSETTGSAKPPLALHIPTTLFGGMAALVMVAYLTYKGFQANYLYLLLMVLIPIGIHLLSHPKTFLLVMLVVTFSKIWLPLGPAAFREIPLGLYARGGLLVAVIATGILRKTGGRIWPWYRLFALVFLAVIGLVIARRGLGFLQLGGGLVGGRSYLMLLCNLAFLLIIPGTMAMSRRWWTWCLVLMLAAPLASVVADLVYFFSGGKFVTLFYLFRPTDTIGMAASEFSQQDSGVWRLNSLTWVRTSFLAMLFFPFLIRRLWGWWVIVLLVGLQLALTALSGFRAALFNIPLTFFFFLWLRFPQRRKSLLVFGFCAAACSIGAAYALAPWLPTPIQRTISWLPNIPVDPKVLIDAVGSSNWRLDMWHEVWNREVPKHWLLGKGLTWPLRLYIDPIFNHQEYWVGINNYILMMNYHNGPLTLLVGFGIVGLLSFTGFIVAAVARHRRFLSAAKWGDPVLHNYHLALYAHFAMHSLLFFFAYGDLGGYLEVLIIFLVLMELLLNSDPVLGAVKVEQEAPRLVDRQGARSQSPRVVPIPLTGRRP